MVQFQVSGCPVPKQSYRHSKKGNYIPERVRNWQNEVSWQAKLAMQKYRAEITELPLSVEIHFFLDHKRRVDLDNLSKAVLDALNDVVWEDDMQIIHLTLHKEVVEKKNAGISVSVIEIF